MEFIPAKTILQKFTHGYNWFGADYNMNLYKSCPHGCIYCNSRSDCYHVENFDTVRALRENKRTYFYNQLDKHFNGLKDKYIKIFGNNYICHSPNKNIATVFKEECRKYGLLYKMEDIVKACKKTNAKIGELNLFS